MSLKSIVETADKLTQKLANEKKDLALLYSLLNKELFQDVKIQEMEDPEEPTVQDPFATFQKVDFTEELPETTASLKSLARKLSFKYADEIPPTLRAGDAPESIEPPKLDVNERSLHLLPPEKKKLLSALDLMFHAGIITPIYYQKMRSYLYMAKDLPTAFMEMLKIVEDAEQEMQVYQQRLFSVKKLLAK